MANAIGYRYLVRYYEADEPGRVELRPRLDRCLAQGYITAAEHQRALAGDPPEGYVAPAAASTDSAASTESASA